MLYALHRMVLHCVIPHLVGIAIKRYQCWVFVKLFILQMMVQSKHDWKIVRRRIVHGDDGLVSENKKLNNHYE